MHPKNENLQLSEKGFALIKEFEGLYLEAYLCPAKVWTIGYGHTGLQHNDGTVYPGRKITRADADRLLAYDVHQFEARVKTFANVPLAQHQFDALVSFDFNTGKLDKSTLLRLVNAGEHESAAKQFGRWVYGGSQKLRGLVRRREAEAARYRGER